ncbi:MAG: hypothetical protein ACE5LU_28295 [Anaerolineae bacterium]
MASIQRTEPIYVEPQPVASERKRRQRRHRLFKAIILLTVPFYCTGFTFLTMLRIEVMLKQVTSSPMFLGGLLFFILVLLIEPWTGAVTNGCAFGAKCASVGAADPVSCLTVIGVLVGIAALAIWLL